MHQIPVVRLGHTAVQVTRVGLGAMPLAIYGRPTRDDAMQVIHRALDLGLTLIDTADAYCLDETDKHYGEQLVHQALQTYSGSANINDVIVATKGTRACRSRPHRICPFFFFRRSASSGWRLGNRLDPGSPPSSHCTKLRVSRRRETDSPVANSRLSARRSVHHEGDLRTDQRGRSIRTHPARRRVELQRDADRRGSQLRRRAVRAERLQRFQTAIGDRRRSQVLRRQPINIPRLFTFRRPTKAQTDPQAETARRTRQEVPVFALLHRSGLAPVQIAVHRSHPRRQSMLVDRRLRTSGRHSTRPKRHRPDQRSHIRLDDDVTRGKEKNL